MGMFDNFINHGDGKKQIKVSEDEWNNVRAQLAAVDRSQAVIEFSPDGVILKANGNFLAAIGYSFDEIKGQHHRIFVDPEYANSVDYKAFWEKLGRGEFDAGQYKRIGKGGKEVWLQASYNPVLDMEGRPYKVVKYATDITTDMVKKLASESEQKRIAQENARIRSALDSVSTNVMIADRDRKIIYSNDAALKMLARREANIRRDLPQFAASNVVGSNIDGFHKQPEHQKNLLETLTTTYRSHITLGGAHFGLAASPVIDDEGERQGTVVEWEDRTDEVRASEEIQAMVDAAAAGDFSQRIDLDEKEGFFLSLAEGLNSLVGTAEKGLNDVLRMLKAIADGILTESIVDDYEGTFGELKNYCNNTSENLSSMLGEIRSGAESIAVAAGQIAQGNSDLSSRTEEQASSLEETASSMEELTSTVKQNADNARQANSLSDNATQVAENGGQLVAEVVSTMNDINESAQKIAEIIGVIDSIAFQTNILALNAAVEAARAGDQGRGFAVVASEVRSLAQRSANAAKDIKTLISASVDKIENGNQRVNKTGETMKEVVTAIKRVSDINAEIAAASAEQAAGIDNISTAVSQMDEMTQQNAALVEQAAAAAESQQTQVETLQRLVARFTLLPDHANAGTVQPDTNVRALPRTGVAKAPDQRQAASQRGHQPSLPKEADWEQF